MHQRRSQMVSTDEYDLRYYIYIYKIGLVQKCLTATLAAIGEDERNKRKMLLKLRTTKLSCE